MSTQAKSIKIWTTSDNLVCMEVEAENGIRITTTMGVEIADHYCSELFSAIARVRAKTQPKAGPEQGPYRT